MKAYQKAAAKNFIDEEQNLVDNVFTYIETAKAEQKVKRLEESQEQMSEGQELILDSDLLVAPDLLKIFTSNIALNETKCQVPLDWKKQSVSNLLISD